MISSIEITRFRGIREGKLDDLTPLVVLVGPNASGKSSVLDALLIGAHPTPGEAVCKSVERHHGVEEGPRWLFWRRGESGPAYLAVTTTDDSLRECQLTLRLDSQQKEEQPAGIAIDCDIRLSSTKDGESSLTGTCSFPHASYRLNGSGIIALRDVPNVCLVVSHGNADQVPLDELYSRSARTGGREQAKAIVAEVVPGLRDIEILTEAGKPIVYLTYEDCAIPAALSGDGIHALVRVAMELASRPDGVVLFEEPEVHQHPRAIGRTIRAVLAAVRRDIQVVMTTHSLELIDYLVAESSEEDLQKLSLYRLGLQDGKLISVRHAGSEVAFARGEIDRDLR